MKKSVLALAAVALIAGCAPNSPGASEAKTEVKPLSFRVDASIRGTHSDVAPIDGGSGQRQVGTLARPDGSTVELVVDEVIVHLETQAELDAFLGRWNGKVLDSFDQQDYLIRVDLSKVDPAALTADLLATEPNQSGEHRAGDERVLRLLALAASEWKRGTEVVVDWLTESTSIETGVVYEADTANVFEWSFMKAGGAMDTGVTAAWQLLQAKGKLKPSIKYMVGDGGFVSNGDLPAHASIHKTSWGDTNAKSCTGGSPCPYHGTDVVIAAMGKVDNKYGSAGPAGPVVSHLVAVGNKLDYWSELRRLERVAEDEHPDVVNLSFTRDVTVGTAHAKKWTDRRMKHIRDTGALIVAAAGNNGLTVDTDTLWVPCESTYVMCVGGMNTDATVSGGSNYGQGDTTTSVEIYGPMCVRSINNPAKAYEDFTTRQVCGTSVASPFVGGVAALVMAADPSLSSEQVRKILNDTAHVGGLGSKVTGSQRRINALAAVAKALSVTISDPKVTIEKPSNNKEHSIGQWLDLKGTATDYMGRKLTLKWTSDKDGKLAEGNITAAPKLTVGTHVITASATDSTGRTGSAKVTVKVIDAPPAVKIVSPANGLKVLEGNNIPLVASSVDPDTYGPIADKDTKWEIRRGGTVVYTGSGHQDLLAAAKVTPGLYTARFIAAGVTRETSFTVTALPPGKKKPTATITKPSKNITVGYGGGSLPKIAFAGTGTDPEDGALVGTRFRWTAYAGNQKKVLCAGSNVPGSGSGGVGIYKNCASFTGQLGLAPGDYGSTIWTVWLEVFDSTSLVGTDTVNVTINYVVP